MPATSPVGFSVGPSSDSPSDDNGPNPHRCGVIAAGASSVSSPPLSKSAPTDSAFSPPNPLPMDDGDPPSSTARHMASTSNEIDIDVDPNPFPEYLVRSLSRPALRMLWHQRLGHLNFRRLSTMHRFVKGMPEFKLPNELESCPICLAAKLRKQPAGTKTRLTSVSWSNVVEIQNGGII